MVGGYWYVRAAIKTGGNPIPYSGFGPLHLPQPDQMPLDPRPRFAVAHYLTDPTIYRKWFFPRLDNAFGPLWPLILIIAVAAAVFLVVRSRNRILRVIAAAALLTAVVYVFTPLTAAGPGRLADRASSPTPATWCPAWCWRWRCCRSPGRCARPTRAPGRRCSSSSRSTRSRC